MRIIQIESLCRLQLMGLRIQSLVQILGIQSLVSKELVLSSVLQKYITVKRLGKS